MPLDDIKDVAAYLHDCGRFEALLARYQAALEDRSIWFEMVFANWLEEAGARLEYERQVNPDNETSVDFVASFDGVRYLMELVRIEHSDDVIAHIEAQVASDGIYGLLLKSDHHNGYFRTAGQLIRLQEKILEKVAKFPLPGAGVIGAIVVDCSNIHVGAIDAEDVRMVAFGQPRDPVWQEYWGKNRLLGLFESGYKARGIEALHERIGAIVFVPELTPRGLTKSFLVVNPAFDVRESVLRVPAFASLECVT